MSIPAAGVLFSRTVHAAFAGGDRAGGRRWFGIGSRWCRPRVLKHRGAGF